MAKRIVDTDIDPYSTLEVHPRASLDVIQAAYRALAKKTHPDIKGGAGSNDAITRLNAAYAMVHDPDTRKTYDDSRGPKDGTLIGDYLVQELIAEGGFGKTYKGEQVILKEAVCIKHCSTVSAAHDAILIQEAKAIWDLRHHALPAMRGMYRLEDDSLALVMSYVPGLTLEQTCEKSGKLDAETTAWIAERILNALLYLHMHGVVHGDIKPQNVIIQPDIHAVVLVDFGLAMVKPTSSAKSQGYTPYFASPEQKDGKAMLPASDYYSLGMLMIYAMGGLDHVKRLEVPDSVPDEICDFIRSMILRDPLARPPHGPDDNNPFVRIQGIREKVFGRRRSGMKPITGSI